MNDPLPLEITPRDVKRSLDAGAALKLIDVREPHEYQISRLDAAELIPMGSVPARLQHLEAAAEDSTLIVICHYGLRSLQVVSWLRAQGLEACQSMAGGLERWSLEVDPAVQRY